MPRPRTYTSSQVVSLAAKVKSMAELLRGLGLNPTGANYLSLRKYLQELGVPTDHWTGQAHRRGSRFPVSRTPIEEFLVEDRHVSSYWLKKRLVEVGLLKNACCVCGITHWTGQPLSLHLDHINGKHNDNRLENLRILCPNCHSLTPTYAGRGQRRVAARPYVQESPSYCPHCGAPTATGRKYCSVACRAAHHSRKPAASIRTNTPNTPAVFA